MTNAPFPATETPIWQLTDEELRARVARAQLYILSMVPTEHWREAVADVSLGRDHIRYMLKLDQEGRLFGAGPVDYPEGALAIDAGAPVEELAIISAASREEADKIARSEPLHKAGARLNTVRAYTSNEGVACYVARAMAKKAESREAFALDIEGPDLTLEEYFRDHAVRAQLYLIQMEPTDKERTPEETAEVGHRHFIWLRENEMNAKLMSCGPLARLDGRAGGGSGLAIVAAASIDEARSLAAAEPNNVAGYRVLTVRRWLLNEGTAAPIGKSLATLNA